MLPAHRLERLAAHLPPTLPVPGRHAGKMAVLGLLLHQSIAVAGDRVVVVSQSTAALDLVQVTGWLGAVDVVGVGVSDSLPSNRPGL